MLSRVPWCFLAMRLVEQAFIQMRFLLAAFATFA
jgi:hypothetical protein